MLEWKNSSQPNFSCNVYTGVWHFQRRVVNPSNPTQVLKSDRRKNCLGRALVGEDQ